MADIKIKKSEFTIYDIDGVEIAVDNYGSKGINVYDVNCISKEEATFKYVCSFSHKDGEKFTENDILSVIVPMAKSKEFTGVMATPAE